MQEDEEAKKADTYMRVLAEVLYEETLDQIEESGLTPTLDASVGLYLYDTMMRKGATHCLRN